MEMDRPYRTANSKIWVRQQPQDSALPMSREAGSRGRRGSDTCEEGMASAGILHATRVNSTAPTSAVARVARTRSWQRVPSGEFFKPLRIAAGISKSRN